MVVHLTGRAGQAGQAGRAVMFSSRQAQSKKTLEAPLTGCNDGGAERSVVLGASDAKFIPVSIGKRKRPSWLVKIYFERS